MVGRGLSPETPSPIPPSEDFPAWYIFAVLGGFYGTIAGVATKDPLLTAGIFGGSLAIHQAGSRLKRWASKEEKPLALPPSTEDQAK